MTTHAPAPLFTAVRDLGSTYAIDDLAFLTDVTHRQHHDAIREAFWAGLRAAADTDARIDSVDRGGRQFTARGTDRAALEDAVDDAVVAGYDAAQALFDANETAWRSKPDPEA